MLSCLVFAYCLTLIRSTVVVDLYGNQVPVLYDEMMLSLRHAKQLIEGNGLVWNPGERVEAFTSPLWTVMYAAVLFVCSPETAPLAIQYIGAVLFAGTCFIVLGLIIDRAATSQISDLIMALIVATVVLLLSYPGVYW